MTSHKWVGLLLIILIFPIHGKKSIHIRSNQTHSIKNTPFVVVSGNVEVKVDNITITSDKIVFNKEQKTMISSQNITIKRDNTTSLNPKKMSFDLVQNKAWLEGINLAMELPQNKKKIYIKSKKIIDHPNYKEGFDTILTSCELSPPHYQAWAQYFHYVPDKRIVASNVFVWNPIWIIPFGFWTPFYWYELGKRKIIWNFPNIGKKHTPGWGYFIQNTIDYNNLNGRISSIFLDYYEKKGFGIGAKNQYTLFSHNKGNIYYYHFKEADTEKLNQKFSFHNNFQKDAHQIIYDYSTIDAERINGSGRNILSYQKINYNYKNLGDTFKMNFNTHNFVNQKTKSFIFNLQKDFNNKRPYKVNIQQNIQDLTQTIRTIGDINHQIKFTNTSQLTQHLHFSELITPQYNAPDQSLKWYLEYTHKLPYNINLSIKTSQLFDLDADRVTQDSFSANNNFLYKHPEITLSYVQPNQFKLFNSSQKLVLGRYQETQYIEQRKEARTFPDTLSALEPNTLIYTHKISKNWQFPWSKTSFSSQLSYSQTVFKIPGKDWFSGDAMNTLSTQFNMSNTFFNFIQNTTGYSSSHTPKENGSPFFAFNPSSSKTNIISQRLKFYAISPTTYYLLGETRYNWILESWDDLIITAYAAPSPVFNIKIKTGKKLTIKTGFDRNNQFRATDLYMNFQPKNTHLNYALSIDTNKLIKNNFYVRHSALTMSFKLGTDPFSQWSINSTLRYNTTHQAQYFDISRYEWQTIGIEKNEHRRKINLWFNRLAKSFSFKYTILAFGEDPVEIMQTNDIWKIGGRFDKSSEERF